MIDLLSTPTTLSPPPGKRLRQPGHLASDRHDSTVDPASPTARESILARWTPPP